MANKIIGKRFDILETTEEILKTKQPRQYQSRTAGSTENRIFAELRKQWSISSQEEFTSIMWSNLLLKARNYPKPLFRDDMSELRQEVDTLKVMVRSLTNTINKLSKENKDIQNYPHTAETYFNSLCEAYIQTINDIEIAKVLSIFVYISTWAL
ncbi:unnamed protein product [marine sediment metagenome]|uniref:Uncharacterized protein n=1 Tax=marine sediment metagenome TaxID=412755 RepID=X1RPC6_9ZZZZ